jgi:DNA mismatch endonuclease (patch repair protein)
MAKVRSKNTKPELKVRRLVFSMGYRYRLHERRLPGKPDLVFPARKKIIFVHGCFWHRHPKCRLATTPSSNQNYWLPKFEHNAKRDKKLQKELKILGWDIMIVWECQLKDVENLAKKLRIFLG